MNNSFKRVISQIYEENGVRSLLFKAEHFGKQDDVEFTVTTKHTKELIGYGKYTYEERTTQYIDGKEAKQMCHDYVMKRIERMLEGVNESPQKKFNELIKTLGL